MKRILVVVGRVFLLALFTSVSLAYAAQHAITPNGSGNLSGSDWNNACAGLTGNCATTGTTHMVRGDTYYLAGGQYTPTSGSNQLFDVADSGSLTIEIRGATAADHGPATGWSSTFDVNTSPARIVPNLAFVNSSTGNNTTIWRIRSSNWILNGNNCTANQVRQFGQGIMIDDSQSAPGLASIQAAIFIDPYEAVNLTLSCVEIKGYGLDSGGGSSTAISSISCSSGVVTAQFAAPTRFFGPNASINQPGTQIAISGVTGGSGFNLAQAVVTGNPTANSITYNSPGCSNSGTGGTADGLYTWGAFPITRGGTGVGGNLVMRYISVHDTQQPMHLTNGYASLTFEYNFVGRWFGNSLLHSEAFSWQGCIGSGFTNTTIRYSYFLDGESSGVWVPLFGACMSELDIYGNVVAQTVGNPYLRTGYGDGVFDCINVSNNTTCTNLQIYNNTFANLKDTPAGRTGIVVESPISTSTWRVENNLWYNDDPSGVASGMAAEDYNTLLNTSVVSNALFTGAHDFDTTSGSADPFIADTAASPLITGFELSSETIDAHLNDGVSTSSLLSGNNIDYNGHTRAGDGTWERGAFEFIPAGNPITLVQVANPTYAHNTTKYVDITETAGDFLVVAAGFKSNVTATVSDSIGNTWHPLTAYVNNNAGCGTADSPSSGMQLWYAENIRGGSNRVTLTLSGLAYLSITVAEYSGVKTSGSLSTSTGSISTSVVSSISTGNMSAGGGNNLIIGAFTDTDQARANMSPGTGYTDLANTGIGAMLEHLVPAGPGTYNPSATYNNGADACGVAAGAVFLSQ